MDRSFVRHDAGLLPGRIDRVWSWDRRGWAGRRSFTIGPEQPPSEPRDEHATIDLGLDDSRGWRVRGVHDGVGLVRDGLRRSSGQDPAKSDAQESKIRESVVKISATMRYPDMTHPWTKHSPQEASGTGVVIDGKRILTNAHVVLYASQLFVESYQSSDKLPARVEAVSPGIDLAVIRLEDESFFDKRAPVVRTEALPEVKETVLVYGYPQGGSTLSVTKGIVSRIEFAGYGEATSGVRVQVDAAINPGNSGGPALVDGKMVGLIFSKLTQADNIGYIIPSEEIDLFLKDVADGSYDGKPAIHESLQTLENDALRAFLKLDKKTQGMVVHSTDPSDPKDPLKPFDLLTKIADHEIDNVGMVKIKDNLRLSFHYLIQKVDEGRQGALDRGARRENACRSKCRPRTTIRC